MADFKLKSQEDLLKIATELGVCDAKSVEPYGSGHINYTYRVSDGSDYYILQKVNTDIFPDFDGVMENITRVSEHIFSKGQQSLRVLGYKNPWRLFSFIEGAHSVDVIENPKQAFAAAAAFAVFQNNLSDMDDPRLNETIKKFHDASFRLHLFDKALDKDSFDRAKNATEEIAFVNSWRTKAVKLLNLMNDGIIPERVTHNDTKINNVMFDDDNNVVAVVDLDTVMPGCALYDFGDMVRTATANAKEDERNLSKVYSRKDYFEQLAAGYLSEAHFLNKAEIDNLVFSGALITFIIGLRFLTDYLNGDTYFLTDYEDHNLVRAKNQFAMVRSIEAQQEEFEQIVRSIVEKRK